ncbi:DUF1003 domain-containing protein [Pseudoduganella sp. OTU4001]|uniref:DUF1003 domain-containing protein n=1 Tax=Pseudoduganella sp. OTU4001 TaxID=3043854 RepID=UPI00313F07CC
MNSSQRENLSSASELHIDHLRFHRPHEHLSKTFGSDLFGLKAEAFARFFGTPVFLGVQTIIVAIWITANVLGLTNFDVYPFILLNLAFSLQAAYAAPLILLAQTRQAARDKAHSEADAKHREAIAIASAKQSARMLELLRQNTELTELTKMMAERIEMLTAEIHRHLVQDTKPRN